MMSPCRNQASRAKLWENWTAGMGPAEIHRCGRVSAGVIASKTGEGRTRTGGLVGQEM